MQKISGTPAIRGHLDGFCLKPGGLVEPALVAIKRFNHTDFVSFVSNSSESLNAFSHQEYHKKTSHSIDYIVARWGRHFVTLDYAETKYQALVILGKP